MSKISDTYQLLFQDIRLLVAELDVEGRIMYVNPHFSSVTGYSAGEVTGMRFDELFHEKDHNEALKNFTDIKQSLAKQSVRNILCKDGSVKQVCWNSILLRDDKNTASGILSIGEDLTGIIKNAEKELVEGKERMEIILSALKTGLALINPDMTVAWVNAETQKILPWDELVGKICYEAAAKRKEPCEGCGALKAFSDGQIHETFRQSPVDGKWHHIVSIPIKDESGAIINVLESVTDITKLKETELERDQTIKELEKLKQKLEEENIYLKEEITSEHGFTEIIGKSNALLYVLTKIQQVAGTNAAVLIQGETGVGKELVARAIHATSALSSKSFIKMDCTSLPVNLVESELFGHEKGAFTGADRLRKGRFEVADGGTIFLDEISELPLEVQNKLLRVLEHGEFERVGSSHTLCVHVRVIAATNRNLLDEVTAGRFRADLFYRLNVYPITVPPLRHRREDIPLLVQNFIPRISTRFGKNIDQIPSAVMERLVQYDWPGNVRELKNFLERAVITSPENILKLPEGLQQRKTKKITDDSDPELRTLEEIERQHIMRVLNATGWRVSGPDGAAQILGINPSTLRFRMKKLHIKRLN
jgi:PAS domain S-box-containing protein